MSSPGSSACDKLSTSDGRQQDNRYPSFIYLLCSAAATAGITGRDEQALESDLGGEATIISMARRLHD